MLVVRDAQMLALAEDLERRYRDGLRDRVQRSFAAECAALRRDELERRIDDALARAQLHGITRRRDAARIVFLDFAVGARFEHALEHAWAALVVGDERRTPGDRLVELYEGFGVSPVLWDAAA